MAGSLMCDAGRPEITPMTSGPAGVVTALRAPSPAPSGRVGSDDAFPSGRAALRWLRYNDTCDCAAGSRPDPTPSPARADSCLGPRRPSLATHRSLARSHSPSLERSPPPHELDQRVVAIGAVGRRGHPTSARGRREPAAGHPRAATATDRPLGIGSRSAGRRTAGQPGHCRHPGRGHQRPRRPGATGHPDRARDGMAGVTRAGRSWSTLFTVTDVKVETGSDDRDDKTTVVPNG